jgi:hypothetical protein
MIKKLHKFGDSRLKIRMVLSRYIFCLQQNPHFALPKTTHPPHFLTTNPHPYLNKFSPKISKKNSPTSLLPHFFPLFSASTPHPILLFPNIFICKIYYIIKFHVIQIIGFIIPHHQHNNTGKMRTTKN